MIGNIYGGLGEGYVISTEVVDGAKRRDHVAEKSSAFRSTSRLTTMQICYGGQRSLIRNKVKRKVYREAQNFSAGSLAFCCGSFGALQIAKDFCPNDKPANVLIINILKN